jgi:hypothetical protein
MKDLRVKAVEKAIAMLDSVGASYHVKFNENEWGQSLTEKAKQKKRLYAGLTDYVRKYIQDIEVGELKEIPETPVYPRKAIQACATTIMSHTFGNGTYMTTQNDSKVDVLRLM